MGSFRLCSELVLIKSLEWLPADISQWWPLALMFYSRKLLDRVSSRKPRTPTSCSDAKVMLTKCSRSLLLCAIRIMTVDKIVVSILHMQSLTTIRLRNWLRLRKIIKLKELQLMRFLHMVNVMFSASEPESRSSDTQVKWKTKSQENSNIYIPEWVKSEKWSILTWEERLFFMMQ